MMDNSLFYWYEQEHLRLHRWLNLLETLQRNSAAALAEIIDDGKSVAACRDETMNGLMPEGMSYADLNNIIASVVDAFNQVEALRAQAYAASMSAVTLRA